MSEDRTEERTEERTGDNTVEDLYRELQTLVDPPSHLADPTYADMIIPNGYVNWDDEYTCRPPQLRSIDLCPPSIHSLPTKPMSPFAAAAPEDQIEQESLVNDLKEKKGQISTFISVLDSLPRNDKIIDASEFIYINQAIDDANNPLYKQEELRNRYTQWGQNQHHENWPYAKERTKEEINYAAEFYRSLGEKKGKDNVWQLY
jgi:hypothetical protein